MKLHHIGIAVRDIAKDPEDYQRALGIPLESRVFEDEFQRVRIRFGWIEGSVLVEFVEPIGEASPVTRWVERGGGVYHVCYQVKNLEQEIDRACRAGGILVTRPCPAPALGNKRIAFVYTRGRNLVEFLEE